MSFPVYKLFVSNSAYAASCPKNPLRNQATIFTFCQKRRTNARLGERHCFVFFSSLTPEIPGIALEWVNHDEELNAVFPWPVQSVHQMMGTETQVLKRQPRCSLSKPCHLQGDRWFTEVAKNYGKTLTASPRYPSLSDSSYILIRARIISINIRNTLNTWPKSELRWNGHKLSHPGGSQWHPVATTSPGWFQPWVGGLES